MSWHWNIEENRYQWVDFIDDEFIYGDFIDRIYVLEQIDESIDESIIVVGALAGFLVAGALTGQSWMSSFRAEIKGEYIRQYLSGIGGRKMMTKADWGSIGGMLKEQYGYLNGFYDDIIAGRLTEGQIRARMAMYINSAREAHERAHGKSAMKWGADEVAWILNPAAATCPDCEERALLGWMRMNKDGSFPSIDGPAWPGDGSTVCLCILSPESKVLTDKGWLSLLDIRVGDMAFTHRCRWKKITSLIVKPSIPDHKFAMLGSVACTSNHLWYTSKGWMNIDNIYNPLYNISQKEVLHNEEMYQMLYRYEHSEQARPMRIVQGGLSLREAQGSTIRRMRPMRGNGAEQTNQRAMGDQSRSNGNGAQTGWNTKAHNLGNDRGYDLANQGAGWTILELVLEARCRQEEYDIPLPVGVDHGEWCDPRGLCHTPYQRESSRRQDREFVPDGVFEASEISWFEAGQQQAGVGLSELRESVPGLSQGGRSKQEVLFPRVSMESKISSKGLDLPELWDNVLSPYGSWEAPQVLLGGLLPPGTAVYDIEVEDDHSFCIEGFFAHNTNCKCGLVYRNSKTDIIFEGA